MEQYSCYKFEIIHELIPVWSATGKTEKPINGYTYKIYGEECVPYDDAVIESSEWFDTKQEARFAAIGHITMLENGGE